MEKVSFTAETNGEGMLCRKQRSVLLFKPLPESVLHCWAVWLSNWTLRYDVQFRRISNLFVFGKWKGAHLRWLPFIMP